MADPMTSLLGRKPFRGTGRTEDYFPAPPDLDFLQRPTFISPGAGYNPKLDPEALVSAGFSPRNAMVLQGLRQSLHEQAESEREYMDTQRAMGRLSQINPNGKNFSQELLSIFRENPRAQRNPEVLQQADFISRFASPQTSWSVEDIEDPDIYAQAIKENWGGLTPQEARRRANAALTQRSIRGELASLGMTKQDLDKITSWSQEDYLREKGRLVREAKSATAKPWYERIGKTAAEDVRTFAQEAKALQDFEDEFAAVLADNPTLTKDAYVKQFKGDPDFTTYRQRRLAQKVPTLVEEYGLSGEEALQVLGLGGMFREAQAASAPVDPFADRTTTGVAAPQPSQAASTAPVITPPAVPPAKAVSQADLKQDDRASSTPVTFETLSQSVTQKAEAARKAREDEFLAQKKAKEAESSADNALWEGAKTKLLQGLSPELAQNLFQGLAPEIAKITIPGTFQEQSKEIFQRAGIDPTKPAFTFTQANGIPGREVSWEEALIALAKDDRLKQIQNPSAKTVERKSFSSLWGGKGS